MYYIKDESNNEENCDFSDPYSSFWESSVTVSSLQVLLFLHIMDCRNHQRVSKLRQISLWCSRTLQVSHYSDAFLAYPFSSQFSSIIDKVAITKTIKNNRKDSLVLSDHQSVSKSCLSIKDI